MIKRYSTKRMEDLWSLENKFEIYLKIEVAASNAFAKAGIIPKAAAKKISENGKVDIKRILKIEEETKHDVIAFTRQLSETLGPEKKWVHYGLTSTDVVDTAHGVQLKEANKYILEGLKKFSIVLKRNAIKYKKTSIMGRTHGIHAEVTSFGLKWALWYDEMQRNIVRFSAAAKNVEFGKISGAIGNHANVSFIIQDEVMRELKLGSPNISTQTLQRDRHADYISSLAIIASTMEKIATEIRHLQRTEVGEVQESFRAKQKGSSAMPHKKNPIASENISGLARVMRGYVIPAMENNILWHERDISHSSVERIILPDATTLIDYMLTRYTNVLANLIVNKNRMLENINLTKGVVFSQRVLTKLIEKGLSREDAYDLVQAIAMESWNTDSTFWSLLTESKEIMNKLTEEEIIEAFDIDYFLSKVDGIYKRVFK